MKTLSAGSADLAAHPLFQTEGGGANPTSALSLWFSAISLKLAKRLNRKWHSRFPENGGGGSRICYAAESGGEYWACAIWTNPTAPALPQWEWMLLKRYAIREGRPKNTASRMLGWMERDIKKRFPEVNTLVSYSDPESHEGTIYKTCGWIRDTKTRRIGIRWHNRKRHHTANSPPTTVVRWRKVIRFPSPAPRTPTKENA